LPENPAQFYEPIIQWIGEYIKSPNTSTNLVCNFTYLNSSSAKKIYEIFLMLSELNETENDVKVTWCCESDDQLMINKGNEYNSILDISFEIMTFN
jgi:ribosomal protein L15E